jgi:glutathione reductase (NADPH)
MPFDFDLFVIGGGSAGVRCARIAAGHGARVAVAEERFWGGTCVNVGCVPKKLLVQAGEYGAAAADSRAFGWATEPGPHDWAALLAAKDREIERLNGVYVRLLERAGVTMFDARATFIDAHTLDVGGRRVTAEHVVIATGGKSEVGPHIDGFDQGIVSDHAFQLAERPRRIVIVGGGYIGVEFAGIFAALGSTVDLVYRQSLPLRGFDADLREGLAAALGARGIRRHPSRTVDHVRRAPDGASTATLSDGTAIETDLVFFAVGRRPHTEGLGLERAGVALDHRGGVIVDGENATGVPGIHAIGDVSNRLNLTPVAIAEGHRLADRLFGPAPARAWDLAHVAKAVFFSPPLASVGLTEDEAAARGRARIYLSRFTPLRHTISGRAANRSLMKLVVDDASDRLLGAHMLGDDAPEIVQGFAVAVSAGLTKADVDRTVGIHPTSAEEMVTMRTPERIVG